MEKRIFLYWLVVVLSLSSAPQVFATDQAGEEKNAPEIEISAEDQKVIALMELLQKMDMLTDLDIMAAAEVKK